MMNFDLQRMLLIIPPLLFSLSVHEAAHGYVAYRFGDNTAKMLGRITLNPIKHLDPIGTLMLLFSGLFGWAKPVPVNYRNLRNLRRAIFWISIAGPLSNLALAVLFSLIYRGLDMLYIAYPQYGGSLFAPLLAMANLAVLMNIGLFVFNMLPIHPLDGSKVLDSFLPPKLSMEYSRLEPYGFVILVFLMFTGVTRLVMMPVIVVLYKIFMGV